MDNYCINKNPQANGDHEMHKDGCSHMPDSENQQDIGSFATCAEALVEAKKIDSDADGCFYCCKECHTS